MTGTTIPNDFLAALMSKKLNATELQVVMALVRITWGDGLDEVQVTLTKLAEMTSSGRTNVSHALSKLREFGIVRTERRLGDHSGNVQKLVRDPARWGAPLKMPDLRIRIFRRDNYTCQYCGQPELAHPTLDHVVPKVLAGSNLARNLRTVCEPCNMAKSTSGPTEFFGRHPDARARLGPLLDLAILADSLRPPRKNRESRDENCSGSHLSGSANEMPGDLPVAPTGGSDGATRGEGPSHHFRGTSDGESGNSRPEKVTVPAVAGDLPAASEVRAGPGGFVCPIFERRCPLKEC